MRKSLLWGPVLVCLGASFARSQALNCEKVANYSIDVSLHEQQRMLEGKEILTWTNTSSRNIDTLYFHLYWNAFKNNRSLFSVESWQGLNWSERSTSPRSPEEWGWIDVTDISAEDAFGREDLKGFLSYGAPGQPGGEDETVLRVRVPRPVPPGHTIAIAIAFRARIPTKQPRTGYRGDFYFLGQWFPKIGVLWDGVWNCHPFHTNTEFFADYGDYDVRITVPSRFLVGATGSLRDSVANADGTTTYRFVEECVHDFAWTASPHYLVRVRRFEHPELPPVTMRLLLQPEHRKDEEAYFGATANTLKYYGLWYGPYPYGHITIVDPAWDSRADGMEYPTLFCGGSEWWVPSGVLTPEWLTIHECGHQWWYGLVGNNEVEHPWLDEGINSYADGRCADAAYGDDLYMRRYFGIPIVFREVKRPMRTRWRAPMLTARPDRMDRRGWEFVDGQSYSTNAYRKPALMLATLEGYLGDELFTKILRTFAQRYRFKHPRPTDFIRVVNELVPENMDWFFDQMLTGSGRLDYAVTLVASRAVPPAEGYFGAGEGIRYQAGGEKQKPGSQLYESEVLVQRLGEVCFPVEVLVRFEDGETLTEQWDGRDLWKRFRYQRSAQVLSAEVDPSHKVLLDVNFTNNSRYREPETGAALKWTVRWMTWLQHLLEVFAFFV
ncbi:MAG: M1 family metallopeptidase [candidate division KSB1 bacterium]|nr:M1 family metallopeptidase [candidate division KSB1 bacterium]MDZ7392749.1 M1 family metallopeptidase [candidate division KSB1 bacterium]